MPPLVDYFILRSQTDGPFALNGTGSIYQRFNEPGAQAVLILPVLSDRTRC